MQVVEDRQGLPPGFASGARHATGPMGLTEVDEGLGAEVGVADVGVGSQGLLVESGCLLVEALLVVAIAEAVEGYGFAEPVAQFAVQVKCALAVAEGVLMVASQGVIPADRVESEGLPNPVADSLAEAKRSFGVAQCLSVALLFVQGHCDGIVRARPPGVVAQLAE